MAKANILENSYYNWLKKELDFKDISDGYISISTPFIDTNYDNISLFANFTDKNHVTVSDFGYTVFNLEELDININKRNKTVWSIFESTLNSFGVTNDNGNLSITTTLDKFPIAKTRLLNAILRLNDLVYLSKETVSSSFNDLIGEFLTYSNVLFTPDIEIPSSRGISSHFDFSIPSKSGNERLVKTCGRPNDINQAKIFNFDVKQTSSVRDAYFIFLLNDYTHKTEIKDNMYSVSLIDVEDKAKVSGFNAIRKENNLLVNA